ncbi:MAG TPA: glycoside hydrolase family 13 protein [Bacillota bacterium]|nr:glycoside hydrolase family 13 protein [Bacillota bacterium]
MIPSIALDPNRVVHCSRDKIYREPFGALKTSTYVDIVLHVSCRIRTVKFCYSYGLYDFSYNEMTMIPMEDNPERYHVRLRTPSEVGILYYWFCIKGSLSDIEALVVPELRESIPRHPSTGEAYLYYVSSWGNYHGRGKFSFSPARVGAHEDRYPHAYQITVYDKNFVTPEWMKGAMMYQIFPDRYARDTGFSFDAMCHKVEKTERIYHNDWYEDVDINGKPETGYLACDFFGGSLRGIAEHIEDIKKLSVDVLYLNPICEARSNHRYDTADYMNVDPILGGNEAFEYLAAVTKENNIAIILDGVFSHTGADSCYFNKFERYKEPGAFHAAKDGAESRFGSWYSFYRDDSGKLSYDSWWGFPDLPNVNENDLSYRDYILGPKGVLRKWLASGASGIRLDVSDELPDSFIREVRTCVKDASDGNAVVLGEVWEDATNKVSYGNYRDFAFGRTHDTVMGYPFREQVIAFLAGYESANEWNIKMAAARERYPDEMYYCMMNLISSHDVPRAITALAGDKDVSSREAQKATVLTPEQYTKGMALMRLAFAIQVGYIGCPCIYYGDEIGMQGYRDPFNRRTYPWGREDDAQKAQLAFMQTLAALRRNHPVLKTGEYRTLLAKGDMLIFDRYLHANRTDHFGNVITDGARKIVFIINRSENTDIILARGGGDKSGAIRYSQSTWQNEEYEPVARADDYPQHSLLVIHPLSIKVILYY